MKGDFSRVPFDPANHFRRVLMQQGRALLDADWNEQTSILLHYLSVLTVDLIGGFGTPEGDPGFKLAVAQRDFRIGAGRYYVNGIPCENHNENLTYFTQADYLDNYPKPPRDHLPGGDYLVYLDMWEHHVTPIEDSEICEVALGGPDTATRAKVVWQVRVTGQGPDKQDISPNDTPTTVMNKWDDWESKFQPQNRGLLKVRLNPGIQSADACSIPPNSAYRGRENQLYRVEIHSGGTVSGGSPSFKWSRDNGSIAAKWIGSSDGGGLILSCFRGFEAGQWIEITSQMDDLHAVAGQMAKITQLVNDELFVNPIPARNENRELKVRRWDQKENEVVTLQDGAIKIKEGTDDTSWIDLEDGIQVQFQGGAEYRTGDYWLIPARTNGTIGWPSGMDAQGNPSPMAVPPAGINHAYAPLWIISVDGNGIVTIDDNNQCRRTFKHIWEL